MSAITAELCIAPVVSDALHSMLIQLRRTRDSSGEDKLEASAKPLPRLEPWTAYIGKASHTLPQQANFQEEQRQLGIDIRGDWRDLRPTFFMLSCPNCSVLKEAARSMLYTMHAQGINCTSCKRKTTSTRWLC